MASGQGPDFFIAGAPKAGTSALHRALDGLPGIALSRPKEPKYFLCDGTPPPRSEHRGPGDAHSRQEWVWREKDYLATWSHARPGDMRGESTPFYLADREAQRRIHKVNPEARFVVLLRDPVDRAYSNWMHLWSDGLEPESDFVRAVDLEEERLAAGWAPFWGYRELGRYGEQLEHLLGLFGPDQVLTVRYRRLVDHPHDTVNDVLEFLGLPGTDVPREVPSDNTRPFRPDSLRTRSVARAVRLGATAGSWVPPRVWRVASEPLLRELHRGGVHRPALTAEQRRHVLAPLLEDVSLLERLTGQDFGDWRSDAGRGSFASRMQVREPAR
jgi:hypothetical protein